MRRLVLLLVAVSAASVSACGETPRPAAGPRVTLKLDAPNDPSTVRQAAVAVTGTVTPADAVVQVGGRDAEVARGRFSAEVALSPGGNVIDVSATARGRRPAVDAVRVIRDMRV